MTFPLKLLMLLMVAAPPVELINEVAQTGRCMTVGESPDARVSVVPRIAPGPPPLFSFRLYEGRSRQRFGNSDLMLDDAGH